jgi:preprotein translocase subunit YajC
MKNFFKIYRIYIMLFVFLWVGIGIMQYFVISPIRQDNKRHKEEIKRLETENGFITLSLNKNEALIKVQIKKIEQLEALEAYYKKKASETVIKYEKEKTSYVRRTVAERRRIFAKLASE